MKVFENDKIPHCEDSEIGKKPGGFDSFFNNYSNSVLSSAFDYIRLMDSKSNSEENFAV